MPTNKLVPVFSAKLAELDASGTSKRHEHTIFAVIPAKNDRGPRYMLLGQGDKTFLRMNSNSYLGLDFDPRVIEAETGATHLFGVGPGAVRFISGTSTQHVELERKLAVFHGRAGRDGGMLFSSAYAAVLGTLSALITDKTLVVSDKLNHNSIINAIRLARPVKSVVYPHCDVVALEGSLNQYASMAKRACIVTDGIFSMRGDHAPLDEIMAIAREHDDKYEEGVLVIVDDSHGVGAFGPTGRGTEEYVGAKADVLIGTLGKSLGANGGYVVADGIIIEYLRETAPTYIYSNPITAGEAGAAMRALQILDSREGMERVAIARKLAEHLRFGLEAHGFETIGDEHPIVPLLTRDTEKTRKLVTHLFENRILATGITYPVVPRGEEEIRFQVTAAHTYQDITEVIVALSRFPKE
ncbi:MAG: aminotransferase class I/II-fold pyridoxal phosphate-dependent enzyme [Parcubacteria group bacterium]|nr:aminotransferase class I/II-fold pyridoxal phosphate-dependent enzyme [Parcubacteria group bacterium]